MARGISVSPRRSPRAVAGVRYPRTRTRDVGSDAGTVCKEKMNVFIKQPSNVEPQRQDHHSLQALPLRFHRHKGFGACPLPCISTRMLSVPYTPCCNNVNRPCATPGIITLNASFAASPNPCRFPKRSGSTHLPHPHPQQERLLSKSQSPGRVGNWRAYGRVRWRFRCFRVGPQSGSHGHVSSPRSSNRACGFPAHGSRTRSCLRPREADRSRSKVSEPVFLP